MTIEEAIADIRDNIKPVVGGISLDMAIEALEQQEKTGHCKDCKYFEYDSVIKVAGIPLIVAHEICSRWGDGCKTKEDGYCFLFEPQESEKKDDIQAGNRER